MSSIRMTGLFSNMDTESIIKEMMAAQETKKTKIVNKKVKLEWTQEIWKSLNKKLYDFTTKSLSTMRLEGSYKTKKATTTHDALVSVTPKKTGNSPSGAYDLKINHLATSQKVTGGDVKSQNLTGSSKLSEAGVATGTEIKVTVGQGADEKIRTVEVTADTTIDDFLDACTGLGLNASFDTAQGRFFISAKNSGKDSKFKIETSTLATNTIQARKDLRDSLNYNSLSNSDKLVVDDAIRILADTSTAADKKTEARDSLLNIAERNAKEETQDTVERYVAAKFEQEYRSNSSLMSAIETKYKEDYYEKDASGNITGNLRDDVLDGLKEAVKNDAIADIEGNGITYPSDQAKQAAIDAKYNSLIANNGLKKKADQLVKDRTDNELLERAYSDLETQKGKDEIDKYKIDGIKQSDINSLGTNLINKYGVKVCENETDAIATKKNGVSGKIAQYENVVSSGTGPVTGVNALASIGLNDVNGSAVTPGSSTSMSVVEALDSEIELDGATLTSNTNEIEVNGLIINLKGIPPAGEKISINVSEDTEGTYNMVKDFIKEYNELLKEMNTMYNATSSKGYDPLSDDDKKAMTDDQIEKWETKIKDSLLRRDGTLDSLTSTMRMSMGTTVEIDGKRYSLANLGISTSTDWTERGLLHIYGDEDDAIYKAEGNKLQEMLKSDPELVGKVIAGVTKNLYESMNKKMIQTAVSSTQTFYNDIEMKNQLTTYKKDITKWEKKLTEMENRYYKQFSAMEVALSKLNSQSSYLSGLLG